MVQFTSKKVYAAFDTEANQVLFEYTPSKNSIIICSAHFHVSQELVIGGQLRIMDPREMLLKFSARRHSPARLLISTLNASRAALCQQTKFPTSYTRARSNTERKGELEYKTERQCTCTLA
jgi:hypothetical protein